MSTKYDTKTVKEQQCQVGTETEVAAEEAGEEAEGALCPTRLATPRRR